MTLGDRGNLDLFVSIAGIVDGAVFAHDEALVASISGRFSAVMPRASAVLPQTLSVVSTWAPATVGTPAAKGDSADKAGGQAGLSALQKR